MKISPAAIVITSVFLAACNAAPVDDITSFEDCVAAGYPVMESYPEQCRTADGRTFTREITDPVDTTGTGDMIEVTAPEANETLMPGNMGVTGRARGPWYFEATFPVELQDSEGNVLSTGFAQADGEWMTEDWVPFTAMINVPVTDSETGTLVLRKANASGEAEFDAELRVPVLLSTDMPDTEQGSVIGE